jgi:hypothetical protein
VVVVGAACKPDLDDRVSVVTTPRVIAVAAQPAEATPGTPVVLTALVVDDKGLVASPPVDWAYCEARKPLAELGPASSACLQRAADFLTPLGSGASVSTKLPMDACRQFGPAVPTTMPGQPAGRPVDADETGGYYQPIRLLETSSPADSYTLERARIMCGLAGAGSDDIIAFQKGYVANSNPSVDALTSDSGTSLAPDDGVASTSLPAGTHVMLHAAWASCSSDPGACTGAESYLLFDLATRTLTTKREAVRVSWLATAGVFDQDHTGRSSDEMDTFSENGWTVPSQAGKVHLWVVLRDERGGTGWQGYAIDVR